MVDSGFVQRGEEPGGARLYLGNFFLKTRMKINIIRHCLYALVYLW